MAATNFMSDEFKAFVPIGDPWTLRELNEFLEAASRDTQSGYHLEGGFRASLKIGTDVRPGSEPDCQSKIIASGYMAFNEPHPREPYIDRELLLHAGYSSGKGDLQFHHLLLGRPSCVPAKRVTWREYRERVCAALLKAGAGRLRVGYPES